MRYQSTLGLTGDQLDEIVGRVEEVVESGGWPPGMPKVLSVGEQVVIALLLLRQSWTQESTADVWGVSQPTISRVKRSVVPLLDKLVCLYEPDPATAFRNRVVLVDGTDVPSRNRRNTGKANYSGNRHRQGLNIQIAASLDGTLLAGSTLADGVLPARSCGACDAISTHRTLQRRLPCA